MPVKTLTALLEGLSHQLQQGSPHQRLGGLTADSRKVEAGWAFVAIRGVKVDGHHFIPHAIDRGAVAVIVERAAGFPLPTQVSYVRVPDTRRALAHMAAAFYGQPSHTLALIGVTGTNGKTTTTYLLEAMLRANGLTPGVIGTVTYRYGAHAQPAEQTTPAAEDLQRLLRQMVDASMSHCVMEVSSHALALDRVWGCRFAAALFTNLSQDHLDFHGDMQTYYAAKVRLFQEYPLGVAVVNRDDVYGARLRLEAHAPVLTYGFSPEADVAVADLDMDARGITLWVKVQGQRRCVVSHLIGRHNVYNILAALTTAVGLNLDLAQAIQGIESVVAVPGRFERVDAGQPFTVLVDYAHTDDALRNVLVAARGITAGRVIVVLGAGGDRDRSKRPRMGRVAAEYADMALITSDNPRTEPPMDIIHAVEAGYQETSSSGPYRIIEDRARAIHAAMTWAQPGDVVVIAGKGHETYQILGLTRLRFDDRLVARQALHAMGFTGTAKEG